MKDNIGLIIKLKIFYSIWNNIIYSTRFKIYNPIYNSLLGQLKLENPNHTSKLIQKELDVV